MRRSGVRLPSAPPPHLWLRWLRKRPTGGKTRAPNGYIERCLRESCRRSRPNSTYKKYFAVFRRNGRTVLEEPKETTDRENLRIGRLHNVPFVFSSNGRSIESLPHRRGTGVQKGNL